MKWFISCKFGEIVISVEGPPTAPNLLFPQLCIVWSSFNPTKEPLFEKICIKLVCPDKSVCCPPYDSSPHTTMSPVSFIAAKALSVADIFLNFVFSIDVGSVNFFIEFVICMSGVLMVPGK